MAAASFGHQSRISIDAAGTAIASFAAAYEYVSESVRKDLTILDTAGIRGTRSHPKERTRDGTYTVSGTINLHPTPAMLDLVMPWILGAVASGTTFALAETVPARAILIDRIAKRFLYDNVYVNRATFRGSAGGLVTLAIDVIGKTEAAPSATAFPTITAPTDPPYVFHDGVLTMVSAARDVTEWELVIDNALVPRFTNSQTATDISAGDRIITLSATTPYTSGEVDLYNINTASAAAATLTLTNGGYSLSFAIANLQVPDQSPVVESRGGEIFLRHRGVAKKSSTTNELIVTQDSTP